MQALCATRRLALTCANPARVRDFAKSLGRLEKTVSGGAKAAR
jgi:hypothetical protein